MTIQNEDGWPDAAVKKIRELEAALRKAHGRCGESFKVEAGLPNVSIEDGLKPHNDYWSARDPSWPRGPWDSDPLDYIVFKAHGLHCEMRRNMRGVWCGYVTVPPGSALCGVTIMNLDGMDNAEVASVFSRSSAWEIGFDCGHIWDAAPADKNYEWGASYKWADGVRSRVEWLAKQVAVKLGLEAADTAASAAKEE